MTHANGRFYLGRLFDSQTGTTGEQPLLYEKEDLTTHAVIVGMTGSGKTGLCLDLMEEAALNRIPALMIDPKGDITNALLHFPQLLAQDFQPWLNADEARRAGKELAQAAADTADLWRNGLAEWDIQPERIQALQDSVRFAVYTPGSDAGLPISILASLKAPTIPWQSNKELLREKISGTVTALLGLIGLKDIDPVRSREHILLANIFEHAWSRGIDLDLGELIMQTQTPPFAKLGVFDVNRFFPEKDRFDLALLLNNILAAPAFQTWIEGEPLDVQSLLYDADGTPRHTIFYIAHLADAERMFFVTLLYTAVETWMRAQSGTNSLRALVYFDEIFGYLPPIGNPPSKEPMLRMLKQARAFGVGMVLASQNPVDIDYKALSNAGTWFIGKLGTDQDKQRLLDGLASAVPGGLDRQAYDYLISALGKRVFLLRNVHDSQPLLFQTRWAMNYLAGPVTRAQIPALNALVGADKAPVVVSDEPPPAAAVQPSQEAAVVVAQAAGDVLPNAGTRPAIPGRVQEYFLPVTLSLAEVAQENGRSLPTDPTASGLLYRPVLLAQADVRFLNRKYNLDYELKLACLAAEPDRRGVVRWSEHGIQPLAAAELERQPVAEARFATLEEPLADARLVGSMEKDFVDWIYHSTQVQVKANEALGCYAGPAVSEREFASMCREAAAAKADAEDDKVEAQYERKLDALEKKLAQEERELRDDEAELARRRREEFGKHAETLIGLFTRRRSSVSASLSKRRMTEKAADDVTESKEAIAAFQQELVELEEEMKAALAAVREKWLDAAAETTEIVVTPFKKDVHVELFGVAWLPYHLLMDNGRILELPAFIPKSAAAHG
ncbi:MAG: ATP-binding protein [Ardenticatenaceae bacterium]|nr:ATP-binding protein [Ardenticatenaceae bacterium]